MTTVGGSIRSITADTYPNVLNMTHSNAARHFLCWSYLSNSHAEPVPLDMTLTLAQAMADGESLASSFISDPRYQQGFAAMLAQVQASTSRGMQPFVVLGDSGSNCLPQIVPATNPSAAAVPLDPNFVDPDLFLAHIYVAARAFARVFAGHALAVQIGNEMNYCWVAALGGLYHTRFGDKDPTAGFNRSLLSQSQQQTLALWRALRQRPSRTGSLLSAALVASAGPHEAGVSWLASLIGYWANATFTDQVVHTLHAAVKAELRALVTIAIDWSMLDSSS